MKEIEEKERTRGGKEDLVQEKMDDSRNDG